MEPKICALFIILVLPAFTLGGATLQCWANLYEPTKLVMVPCTGSCYAAVEFLKGQQRKYTWGCNNLKQAKGCRKYKTGWICFCNTQICNYDE